MKVIDNKALLLRLRDPRKVTEVIPKSKELSGNRVVVNWGVDEAHVLKNLNINAPSPIEGKYKWTGKYKPFGATRRPRLDSDTKQTCVLLQRTRALARPQVLSGQQTS